MMEAYKQGKAAFASGESDKANPYDYGTDRTNWRNWNDGFSRAYMESESAKG